MSSLGRRGLCLSALALVANSACSEPRAVQSGGWQPFTGRFRTLDAEGQTVREGRYWRSADGSDRREVGSSDPNRSGIQIRNVAASLCYRFKPSTGWTVQPMRLPAAGWRPPLTGPRGASEIEFRGFRALRAANPTGDYVVALPALNFFRVERFSRETGRREEYFDLELGEPTEELFLPPPNVSLTRLEEPAGIIASEELAATIQRGAGRIER